MAYCLVETGLHGAPDCYSCPSARPFEPGDEVVCRTGRGIERGRVRTWLGDSSGGMEVAGVVLRPLSDNDRLLAGRLERFRLQAIEACEKVLATTGVAATLVDAEQLLDGEHLYFHFLGDVDGAREAVMEHLADTWERRIGFRRFAERLAQGCGPGCGTTAARCGTGACSGCGVAGSCGGRTAAH